MQQFTFSQRFKPLFATRFFTSLNESIFKLIVVLSVLGTQWDYFHDASFLLLVGGSMILPFFLFALLAGYVADHIQKRYIMIVTRLNEIVIMFLGTLALVNQGTWGYIPLLVVLFLISANTAFYSPALKSNLPELFSESELSWANGLLSASKFFAIIIGVCVGMRLFNTCEGNYWACGIFFGVFAVANFIATYCIIPVISPIQEKKERSYTLGQIPTRILSEFYHNPGILMTALGDALFVMVGVSSFPLIVLFSRYTLHMSDPFDTSILQLAPIFGIGLGVLLSGKLSGKKIELGLIPIGALGMTLCLPLAVYFYDTPVMVSFEIPETFISNALKISFMFAPVVSFYFMLTGLFGGLLVVPLRAFLQQRTRPELRGAVISAKNAMAFFFGMLGTALTILFALGGCREDVTLPEFLRQICSVMPAFAPQTLLVSLSILVLLGTFFTMWILPNFMLRFIILALGNTLYKIKMNGIENIPERGSAILLSNHVSLIDSVLISACTSRQVRFLLHEDYYKIPLLRMIARCTGFFKVPSSSKSKSMQLFFDEVQSFIRRGGIVCVFPEGKLSHNGLMSRFKHGYMHMIPEDVDVPIIPVSISFVWGSVFSHYLGKIKMRFPSRFPYFATVSFGEPMPKDTPVFEIRQRICELSADAAENPHPDEKTLHMGLACLAKRHPLQPLWADVGGKEYTALKAFLSAVLLSREFRKIFDTDATYVGVLLPNSTAAALSMTAVMMADRVPSPLNYSVSQETFDISVEKADIKCIITARAFLEKIRIQPSDKMVYIEDIVPKIPGWKKWVALLGFFLIPCKEYMNIISPLSYADLNRTAALLFSSGSTGIPKGVMLSQHNVASDVHSIINAVIMNPSDVILGNLPLFHSFGLNVCFWVSAKLGTRVIYTPNPLDAAPVCSAVAKYKVTLLFSTPSFLQKYMHKAKDGDFDSLRLIVTGAEKLRKNVAEKFGEFMKHTREITEGYGCTELSPVVTINLPEDVNDVGRVFGKPDSIGVPLENIAIRILDPLSFKPVAPDEEGLLFVKGPMVMQGYLKDPKLTEKVMRDGYYNTGDIAKMDESGYINICGRLSRFSKIAGEMVPHEMVEAIICEMCPSENRVIAVGGMPDPVKGEVLLVLYTEELSMTPEAIVDQLRERSISNLWIPKVSNFYKVDHLPLLGSGKLDLSLLHKMAEQIAEERAQQR